MAQKSGFFNALLQAGVYDRKYSAEDYTDNLAVVISNGVLRSTADDLKVTASGLDLTVNVGRAWINGHYYHNTTAYALPAVTPPIGGDRIDRVVLRLNTEIMVRSIELVYKTGESAIDPVAPSLIRSGSIYELCLAEISVAAAAQTVTVKDTRADASLCGWVYSTSGDNSFFTSLDNAFDEWFDQVKNTLASVTLFKQYREDVTLTESASIIGFNIPQYDPDVCILQVYVNGMLTDDYLAAATYVTFSEPLTAGAVVTFIVYKSIDGTGLDSVLDEITQLQNEYATISGASKYVYKATGVNDNWSLSQIAAAIYAKSYDSNEVTEAADAFLTALGGNAWLAALPDDAQVAIEVVGTLGVTSPYAGSGAVGARYRYFDLGASSHSAMRLTFDFKKAQRIDVYPGNDSANIVFFGADLHIKNCRCVALNTGAGCEISMTSAANPGDVTLENCDFTVETSGKAVIANQGSVINSVTLCKSSGADATNFAPGNAYSIRVIGGKHRAYTASAASISAVVYIASLSQNAVAYMTGASCPAVRIETYAQNYLAAAYAGTALIDAPISTLPAVGDFVNVINRINVSKEF